MATQPTAVPAPEQSIPPASSRPVADFSNLRNELKTSTALYAPPSPDPVVTEPAPAGSTPPETTPPPADPAILSGSTPTEPAPASTEPPPASSDFDSWASRYGGDRDRAAREAFALEQRAAAMAQELKALKARPAGAPEVPTVTEAVTAPPAEPAHPAPPPPAPEDLQQIALQAASADRVCCDLDTQYATNETRLGQITRTELPSIESDIAYLTRRVAEVKESDPVAASELTAELDRKLLTKERLATEAIRLDVQMETTKNKYRTRFGAIRERIESERKAKTDREAAIHAGEQDASAFANAVKASFLSEFVAQKLDPEVQADLFKVVGRAIDVSAPLADVPRLVRDLLAEEQKTMERYHRVQSRHFALQHAPEPAPANTPAATVAAPVPTAPRDLTAHLDSLKLMTRQASRSRRVGP